MAGHCPSEHCTKGLGGVKGVVDGAFTMNLTKSGNWTIRSATCPEADLTGRYGKF